MQIEHNLQLIVAISFLRRFSPGHFLPPLFNFAATVLCVDIRLKFPTASSLTAVIKCWLSLSRKARGEAHKVATCCLCVSGGGGGALPGIPQTWPCSANPPLLSSSTYSQLCGIAITYHALALSYGPEDPSRLDRVLYCCFKDYPLTTFKYTMCTLNAIGIKKF